MKTIDGISIIKQSGYCICHITDLTEEIKELLRNQLSFICYGQSAAQSGYSSYNYVNTLREFTIRYESKGPDKQKGMIGELMSHLIINEFFNDYYVASSFFNKEERSVKKGFDIVLLAKSNFCIWITEIKSGGLHKNKNSNSTTNDLIGAAKQDLIKRLKEGNRSLWLNAMVDAKLVFEKEADLKDAVVEILDKYGSKAETADAASSDQISVFLVSTLFAPLVDAIDQANIAKKTKALIAEKQFKTLFILAIQKGTYQKVFDFLKAEGDKS